MAAKVETKTTFQEHRSIEPFYTGGEITADRSGKFIASTVDDEDCLIVDATTTKPLCKIEGDGEAVTSIALTAQANHVIICSRSLSMRIFQLRHEDGNVSAELVRSLKPHTTPVVSSTTDATGTLMVTGGADGIVKVWDIRGGYCSHTFSGHGGVITALELFESTTALTSIKSTSKKRKVTEVNADGTKGSTLFLASSSEDGRIKIHNLNTRQEVANLESHTTVVRALKYSVEQDLLVSASRDRSMVLWSSNTWKSVRVIPAAEELESAGFCGNNQYIYAAGEHGRLRLWSIRDGQEIESEQREALETESIVSILKGTQPDQLLAVRANQVLELYSCSESGDLDLLKTFSGNHDEIIDLAYVDSKRLALADNTESVKIISTSSTEDEDDFGSNISTLAGHEDVVLCLDVDPHGKWLATGSKDNSARLWKMDEGESLCYATFAGHTGSVGAVALPQQITAGSAKRPPQFLITGSEDKTVKKWDCSRILEDASGLPQAVAKSAFTRIAHDKDINAIDLSPISPIFASASQDRSIKIWSAEDGSTVAVLKGHKRGVWSIKFSPSGTPALNLAEGGSSGNRGLLVSGSGDNTVKIWSLNTYACLLTFEGHQNSVLKVIWVPPPATNSEEDQSRQQNKNKPMIASASSDTLIKLWNPYASTDTDHLLATLDGHTDRVWSLAAPTQPSASTSSIIPSQSTLPYSLISGAADARLVFWSDTTSTTAAESSRALTERVEQDQLLANHILAKNYKEVITLSLALNHPGRLLRVFEDIVSLPAAQQDQNSQMGLKSVDAVLASLNKEQIYKLLERVRDWNTNARTATVAQKVLGCLLRLYPRAMWVDMARDKDIARLARASKRDGKGGNGMRDLLRALEVYTERHYKRMEELADESYLLEYTLREMDEVAGTTVNGHHANAVMV